MITDNKKTYRLIYNHVISSLEKRLSPQLTYHCPGHTKDVLEQAIVIAQRESIHDEEEIFLLKVACLYHDTGFFYLYTGHEARGCEICREELPQWGLTTKQIDRICGMIMATKIPQTPYNKLEEIICDADLDYLGRDDFEPISNTLFSEFLVYGFVKDEDDWMRKQIGFFELHHFFTPGSIRLRAPVKAKHLEKIKAYFSK